MKKQQWNSMMNGYLPHNEYLKILKRTREETAEMFNVLMLTRKEICEYVSSFLHDMDSWQEEMQRLSTGKKRWTGKTTRVRGAKMTTTMATATATAMATAKWEL